MLNISEIKQHYDIPFHNELFYEYMLKEYFHYKILNIIFSSKWNKKLSFIGETCLRIVHNIDRFSEDLDFDAINLSREEFMEATDYVIHRLQNEGINIKADDKQKDQNLNAFRRNWVFPELLFDQNISGHKDQKFIINIESEPHFFDYLPARPIIQKFNIFTPIYSAPVDILLSMKICALLQRQKGRDFYDVIFLTGKTKPNYNYLTQKLGIQSPEERKDRILSSCKNVNFKLKAKDFERLTYQPEEAKKIKLFIPYIKQFQFE